MQPGEIGRADRCHASRRDDAVDGLAAEAGHAQQVFTAGAVHIERKTVAVPQCPGEFRIDVERQHAGGLIDDLIDVETIEPHQPVGLIKPMLPDQRRG